MIGLNKINYDESSPLPFTGLSLRLSAKRAPLQRELIRVPRKGWKTQKRTKGQTGLVTPTFLGKTWMKSVKVESLDIPVGIKDSRLNKTGKNLGKGLFI